MGWLAHLCLRSLFSLCALPSVNFNKFLIWWYHQHTDGKKGSAYTQRFKLMHAKLTTSEFNVDKVITQDSGGETQEPRNGESSVRIERLSCTLSRA